VKIEGCKIEKYKKQIRVGDLILYNFKGKSDTGMEDIGYVSRVFLIGNTKKYSIFWFRSSDFSQETKESFKDMPESYMYPVLRK
jgi:hypothetical protein